jgi:hypothetical protein
LTLEDLFSRLVNLGTGGGWMTNRLDACESVPRSGLLLQVERSPSLSSQSTRVSPGSWRLVSVMAVLSALDVAAAADPGEPGGS